MRFLSALRNSIWILALCLGAPGQTPPPQGAGANDVKGMVPREAPANYQAQGRAGKVTIGAEFMRHAIPTSEGELSTEDYVVVEAGLFGAPGDRLRLDVSDFSLRVNGKKPLVSRAFGVVLASESVKDPQWEPPEAPKASTGGIQTGGGGGGEPATPPPTPKMPLPLRRAMEAKVVKGALPEGDRALPVAGLIYFPYRGKSTGIQKVELIYDGPAGKATLNLQP